MSKSLPGVVIIRTIRFPNRSSNVDTYHSLLGVYMLHRARAHESLCVWSFLLPCLSNLVVILRKKLKSLRGFPNFFQGHEYTLVLNEAYKVLTREDLRREYDASIGQLRFSFGRNIPDLGFSTWNGPFRPQALFVDENACIGYIFSLSPPTKFQETFSSYLSVGSRMLTTKISIRPIVSLGGLWRHLCIL